MRIIGGKHRSRMLAEFAGEDVRPTSDRAKEALFNILSFAVRGARVLDLFAGSGALGLESLSRGAREAVFNDASKASIAIVKKNIATLKEENVRIYNYDFSVCLDAVQGQFDIVFIDPPYSQEYGAQALKKIAERGLLTKDGIAVYERDRPFDGEVLGLEKYDERRYGKAYFTFFRSAKE